MTEWCRSVRVYQSAAYVISHESVSLIQTLSLGIGGEMYTI